MMITQNLGISSHGRNVHESQIRHSFSVYNRFYSFDRHVSLYEQRCYILFQVRSAKRYKTSSPEVAYSDCFVRNLV